MAGLVATITDSDWDKIINLTHKNVARISNDEFVEKLSAISPNIEVLGKYRNHKTPIEVLCKKCGHKWSSTPSNLLRGSGCIACAGLKNKTTAEFIKEMAVANPDIVVLGEYINYNTKIRIKNIKCFHEWDALPGSLLKGSGCPKCANNRKKTQSQFIKELQIKNPNILVLGEYKDAKTKIDVQCKVCGANLQMTPNSLLTGHGCATCNLRQGNAQKTGKTHLKMQNEFVSLMAEKMPSIEILGRYLKSKERIRVKCKKCGHEWMPLAGSLLGGHGCPKCCRSKKNLK